VKDRPASTIAEKMIKVDHAGENGAVNIYRAQLMIARVRSRHLIHQLDHNMRHEMEHRQIFRNHLSSSAIRRCRSYLACGIGGFALGLVTGCIGPSAIAATTYAVEKAVLEHLEIQLSYLKDEDEAAYRCVIRIVDDEKAHHDAAVAQLQADKMLTRVLVRIVRFSTEQVIRYGMR